jgi:aerobic carbon-monoxide dehydrogenase medium subunit
VLEPGELIAAVSFPKAAPGSVAAIAELSRRRGDYAMAGLAMTASLTNGQLNGPRIVYFGCTSNARLAQGVARVLERAPIPLPSKQKQALDTAVAADIDPTDSPGCTAATRLRLATVLTSRILLRFQEKAAA